MYTYQLKEAPSTKKWIVSIIIAIIALVIFIHYTTNKLSAAITDCTTLSGNLIQNCGLEDQGPLPAGAGNLPSTLGANALQSGYTGLTHWTILSPVADSNVALYSTNDAPQAKRVIDLSGVTESNPQIRGERAGSGIEQVVTGLTIGERYSLSFYQSTSPNPIFPSEVTLLIDGVNKGLYTMTNSTPGEMIGSLNWVKQTYSFIATTTSATITLRSDFDSVARGFFAATSVIDNISLLPDPIPVLTLSTTSTTVTGPFSVTITPSANLHLSLPISGLALNDFVVTNATVSNLAGPDGSGNYTVTITPTGTNVSIYIPDHSVSNSMGTQNSVNSNTLLVTYSTISPIISPVHIQSNNASSSFYATTGDVVTLTYTLDVVPTSQFITLGGQSVTPVCSGTAPFYNCSGALLVTFNIPASDGIVPFVISATVGSTTHTGTSTTDGSSVTVDRSIPVVTITNPTNGSTVRSTMKFGGACETGLTVIITGSGFTPMPTSAPCIDGAYLSPVLTVTSNPTVIATQTDQAGHTATATASYVLPGGNNNQTLVVTITGPSGVTGIGANTITGTCQTNVTVTISGVGFTPPVGTADCTDGTYSYPITITGNTMFTVSQAYEFNVGTATGYTTLPSVSTGGGNGGGGSSGCIYPGGCNNSSTPIVSTPIATPVSNPISQIDTLCPKFRQYIRKGNVDGQNGINEVSKVQSFLNRYLGILIPVDGIFGTKTYQAVSNFQANHFAQVLAPWGLTSETGWWYQSTRSYANYIEGCSEGVITLDNGTKIKNGEIVQ